MSPEPALLKTVPTHPAKRTRLRAVPDTPLRVADVALFSGERSGGIRTYLDAKGEYAARTGEIEHHVLVPGARERHDHGRHELPSLRVVAANGYRIPLGAGGLKETLRALRPDVVLLHDPFWWPVDVIACAREIGACTVAVHHGTSNLEAATLPGPSRVYAPLWRRRLRRSGRHVDAVMSNVDTMADFGRLATMPLRLGVHETFGLVALEAAACGTPVAACSTAPALHAIGALGHGFVPGDPDDLDRAIAAAREAVPDIQEAAMIGWRHGWQRVFDAETASLRGLVG